MEKPKTEEVLMLGPRLTSLREKLGRKAKQEPQYRFYTLYGHIHRDDVLIASWNKVYANHGASGVDNVSFKDIMSTEGGITEFLHKIQKELREKTYRPQPVKRVYILSRMEENVL